MADITIRNTTDANPDATATTQSYSSEGRRGHLTDAELRNIQAAIPSAVRTSPANYTITAPDLRGGAISVSVLIGAGSVADLETATGRDLTPAAPTGGGRRSSEPAEVSIRLGPPLADGAEDDGTPVLRMTPDGEDGVSQADARAFMEALGEIDDPPADTFSVTIDGEAKTIAELRELAYPSGLQHVTVNFGSGSGRRGTDNQEIPYMSDGRRGLSHAEISDFLTNLDRAVDRIADSGERRETAERIDGREVEIEGATHTVRDLRALRDNPEALDDPDEEGDGDDLSDLDLSTGITNTLTQTAEIRRKARAERRMIRQIINNLLRGGNLTWEKFMAIMDLYGVSKGTYTREAISYVLEQQSRDEARQEELTAELRELSESQPDNYGARVRAISAEQQQLTGRLSQMTNFLRDARDDERTQESLAKSLRDSDAGHGQRMVTYNS